MGGKLHGPDYQNLHRNKRSLTLDLKSDEGRGIFMELAKTADVVVENYRSDVKTRLGIDYERCIGDQPAYRLWQHFRLRPDRAGCDPAGRRSNRAGHGRADVDHGRRVGARCASASRSRI